MFLLAGGGGGGGQAHHTTVPAGHRPRGAPRRCSERVVLEDHARLRAPTHGRPAPGRPEGAAGRMPAQRSLPMPLVHGFVHLQGTRRDNRVQCKVKRPRRTPGEATVQGTGQDSSTEARQPGGGPPGSQYVTPLAPSEGPRDRSHSVPAASCNTPHATGRAEGGGGCWIRGQRRVSRRTDPTLLSSLERRCYDLALTGSTQCMCIANGQA